MNYEGSAESNHLDFEYVLQCFPRCERLLDAHDEPQIYKSCLGKLSTNLTMYSVEIWHVDSDLIALHKQQGVGQVDVGLDDGFMKCCMNSSRGLKVSRVAAGMQPQTEHRYMIKRVHLIEISVRGVYHVGLAADLSWLPEQAHR